MNKHEKNELKYRERNRLLELRLMILAGFVNRKVELARRAK